ALAVILPVLLFASDATARSKHKHPRALLVGTYNGHKGRFKTIQAAVDAAQPGDWILIGSGDYHERADHSKNRGPQSSDTPAALIIAKPNYHLRGMSRRRVVVDGPKPG